MMAARVEAEEGKGKQAEVVATVRHAANQPQRVDFLA
jgi:hypothetical protein